MTERSRRQQSTETTTEVATQKTVEAYNEVQKVVKRILSQKHQKHQQQDNDFHNVSERDEDRDLQGRKQEIRSIRKAQNLKLEHSTERSSWRGPRRAFV